MITMKIWHNFKYVVNDILTSDSEVAEQLITNIIVTPFGILADIICLPFEIIWLIALSYIRKIRK